MTKFLQAYVVRHISSGGDFSIFVKIQSADRGGCEVSAYTNVMTRTFIVLAIVCA